MTTGRTTRRRGSLQIYRPFQAGRSAKNRPAVTTVHWSYTVKATSKRASMYMQHWWRFADGKIVFFRGSEDSEQTVAAFSEA